jgi:meso-butanediol dehydrogenase / (S,S)-butanediol dehydrogenase / diacetyl reductase
VTEGARQRRFAGKNVLVTGASSGIGQAIALAFAEEGAHVVAVGRDAARLRETQSRAPEAAAVTPLVLDIRDHDEIAHGVRRMVEEAGHIHVLVNCAGIAPCAAVLDITPQQWNDVIATNLSAPFFMSQAVARHMVESGGGTIVNVTSANAFVVESPYADYNASKAGLGQLTTSMAFELGHLGVRCVAVAPGMTMTPMMDFTHDQETYRHYMSLIPMRRPATPREQANVVLFVASDEASYVNGVTIRVDGGIMHGFWADPRSAPPVDPGEGDTA